MASYYNEIDPFCAAWLRNLITAGHIAPGDVDERSIEDVCPDDLRNYTQCHFFAGVGVWSYALRRAGWPDDRRVWTGSCPCQPFSAAGKGAGFADERHLWPAWFHLIEQLRPATVLGEQVASKAVDLWVDLVQDDLEVLGYAFGAIPFPSASVGAPHIRDRCYWVADTDDARSQGWLGMPERTRERSAGAYSVAGGLADAERVQNIERHDGNVFGRQQVDAEQVGMGGGAGGLADAESERGIRWSPNSPGQAGWGGLEVGSSTSGFWRDADWLWCRDEKWRPVEPGTFPLAHGATSRLGRLRAYGNAINAQAAQAFIESYLS